MTTRAVGAGAGVGWLKQAVNLGRNNPKAIFGGAAWMLVVILAVALVTGVAMGGLTAVIKPGMAGMFGLMFLVLLPVFVVMSALMVGYLRLIDAVESSRPASAFDVFSGFRDLGTSGRAIVFVVLLAILQNVLLFGLVKLLAPGVFDWYGQLVQAGASGQPPAAAMASLPSGLGLAYVVMVLVGIVAYAIQAVGIGQIALRGRGVGAALSEGLSGSVKNVLPLLVFVLVAIAAAIVAAIAVVLVVMVIGLLAKVAGAWLGIVLGVPLYFLAMLVGYVIAFGIMYFMWRDIAGDGAPSTYERSVEA